MRVLVLVQSTDNSYYQPLIEAQQQTWDSVPHPDVTVVYYKPDPTKEELNDNVLDVCHNKNGDHTFFVLMKALRFMLKKEQWDFVVKTDNSVYVDKQKLYDLLLTKPKEKYFGGVPITHDKLSEESRKNFPPDIKFLWGEFLIMSRDCAVHLVNLFNKAPLKGVGAEDIIISTILKDYCIWDESIEISIDENDTAQYAYRVRRIPLMYSPIFGIPPNIIEVINSDITIMNHIHNLIINGQTDNRQGVLEEAQN
jgi:hypothetical protein